MPDRVWRIRCTTSCVVTLAPWLATGIALTSLLANGTMRQVVVAGVVASRANGTALVGTP